MLVFGLIVAVLFSVGPVQSDSLYDSNDPILELDTDTFNAAVYGSKKAHFVEFYSSWCGACIGYAPTFKKFSREISTWSPLVQVTVVNCADDKNMPLCREHSVSAYPTLKYFKYLSANKDDAMIYRGDKYDVSKMEQDIAGLVQADQQKQIPETWPIFSHISDATTLTELFQSIGSTPYLSIISQENPATIAWANIINYHGSSSVRVASISPKHPIATQFFGSEAENRALLFSTGNSEPLWKSSALTKWTDVEQKINETLVENGTQPQVNAPAQVQPTLAAPAKADHRQYEVQLTDIQSAMSYMLYKEIPRREEISGEPLAALKQWIHTLKKYAPGTTPMRRLFYRLDEWLQLQSTVTSDAWTSKVDEIQQSLGNPLPKEIYWISCGGSKPNLRGYTCGLWTLAHTVSAEAYKSEKDNVAFKPVIDVLEPFRAFIFHFLSCSECAQNFTKEAEKHQLHLVTRAEDVYAWLWKVHNFVNARLSGSPSDDPAYPKQQFPPKSICPTCYDANGVLDEAQTLPFVLDYYLNIKQDTVKTPPGYKFTEYKDGKMVAAGSRHLNPKFAVHAQKVDKLEDAEKLRKELDASPQRNWKTLNGYDNVDGGVATSRAHLYFIWLTIIGCALIFRLLQVSAKPVQVLENILLPQRLQTMSMDVYGYKKERRITSWLQTVTNTPGDIKC
ncbi:unnamed protein product [Caenorhabditis auriculariae]|uniref:Sulfhydryl oxidase n=1 Tax=Caenorhabditis auriculariae TaxID=2777116 RepID=A0A8S1GPR9_9PELO|nr:unnamed protein product [Caenorhabditis auriculariae]